MPIDADPTATVKYHSFLDYDPRTRPGMYGIPGQSSPDPGGSDGGVRVIALALPEPPDMTQCHTLEILVALEYVDNHEPSPPGGDSAVWFYSPTGDLNGCPVFDAGASSDAASDGGG